MDALSYSLMSNYGRAVKVLLLIVCALDVFGMVSLHAGDTPSSLDSFKTFFKSGLPSSGEITVAKTIFNPQPYPPPPKPVATAPATLKYQAVWRGDNFVLQELTPQSVIRTNGVSGLLVGQKDQLFWNAAGHQLNFYSKTNNQASGAYDNDVRRLVDVGRSLTRSFVTGLDFKEMVWQESHFSAKLEGIAVEGYLNINSGEMYQLSGKIVERGETGQFRIDYFEWVKTNGEIYPRKCSVYQKFPGDNEYNQIYATEILDFKSSLTNSEDDVFDPDYYIDKKYFNSYAYISNNVYAMGTTGPVRVRNIPPPLPEGKPQKTFILMVLVITAIIFPAILFLKLKPKKAINHNQK